jgi:peptidoglycan/LPS O-acetylase OafA/YrhL
MEKYKPSHLTYRPDIDGLRALAVLSVVLFHAFPEIIHGGFIGVDIFFVISGYLISSIIFKELENGSFNFGNFYSRRIKRIFPALILILMSTLAFGWFVLFAEEYQQLGKHIAGASTFTNNFMFWQESGYFDNDSNTKPLLHLWSLSIEEQFYLVWPLFLYVIYKYKALLGKVLLGLTIGFTLLHFYIIYPNRVAAFYAPYARFFELLIGAYIAYQHLNPKKIHPLYEKFKFIQSFIGLCLILIGIEIINKGSRFPGFYALLSPVLGTALIIHSHPDSIVNKHIFSNKILIWIGLISYPLYLWHWPILSFAYTIESQAPSLEIRIGAVILAIILGSLTYYFIEKPIRFGNKNRSKFTTIFLMFILVCNGLMGYLIYKNNGLEKRRAAIKAAKNEGDVGHKIFYEYSNKHFYLCTPLDIRKKAPVSRCFQSKQNQPIDIAIIGDSHAEHLFIGLAEAIPNKNIVYYIGPKIPITNNKEFSDIFNYVISDKNIKTVILSAYWRARKNEFPKGSSLFKELLMTSHYLNSNKKKVFITNDVPNFSFDPKACKYTRPLSGKNNCQEKKSVFFEEYNKYESVFESLGKDKSITVLDTVNLFCDHPYCSMENGHKLLYRDKDHLNINGSKYLANEIVKKYPSLAR